MSKLRLRPAAGILSASVLAARVAAAAGLLLAFAGALSLPAAQAGTSSAVPAHSVISAGHGHAFIPANMWDGNPQDFFDEAFPNDCARIDGAGALIIGVGDCTAFEYSPINQELVEASNINECLSYDATGARDGVANSYDLLPCGINGVASDEWQTFGSGNYSEWFTVFNNQHSDCLWETGTGTSHPLSARTCDLSNNGDRWEARG